MALTPLAPVKIDTLTDLGQNTVREEQIAEANTGTATRPFRLWRQRLTLIVSEIQAGFVAVQNKLNALIVQTVSPWMDVAYSAANFTTNTAGSWTVPLAAQSLYRYCLIGNSMTLQVTLLLTTIGNPTTTELRIAIPPGYRASENAARQGGTVWNTSAAAGVGAAFVQGGGQFISLQRVDAAAIGNAYPQVATDMNIGLTMTFEVNPL